MWWNPYPKAVIKQEAHRRWFVWGLLLHYFVRKVQLVFMWQEGLEFTGEKINRSRDEAFYVTKCLYVISQQWYNIRQQFLALLTHVMPYYIMHSVSFLFLTGLNIFSQGPWKEIQANWNPANSPLFKSLWYSHQLHKLFKSLG